MAQKEKALVMREMVEPPKNGAMVLTEDATVAIPQLLQQENVSQRMMNIELHSLMIASQQALVEQLKQMAEQQRDFYKSREESFEQKQKFLDREEDRKLKREREEATTRIIEQAGHSFLAVLPMFVNKITKSKVPEAEARTLQPLIQSIRREQWEALAGILDGEQLMILQHVVESMPDTPSEPLRTPEQETEEPACEEPSTSTE